MQYQQDIAADMTPSYPPADSAKQTTCRARWIHTDPVYLVEKCRIDFKISEVTGLKSFCWLNELWEEVAAKCLSGRQADTTVSYLQQCLVDIALDSVTCGRVPPAD